MKKQENFPFISRVTSGPKSHFFGYFDKIAWSGDGTRVLAHEVPFDDRPPLEKDLASVGYVEAGQNGKFIEIAKTSAWNFQQGAMLQWHPAYPDNKIIFNDRHQGVFVGVICDVESNSKIILPSPVSAVSKCGHWALSLNFSRLHEMRPGYGYAGIPDPYRDIASPQEDGIKLINLENGEEKKLFSIDDIVNLQHADLRNRKNIKYWFNHTLFAPDSKRFCFFLRSRSDELGASTHTQLFTANIDGSDIYCLDDSGSISHFDWRSSTQLLAWARKKKNIGADTQRKIVGLAGNPIFRLKLVGWILNKLRGNIIGWVRNSVVGDRFVLYTDKTSDKIDVGIGKLTEDAHCAFSSDGKYIAMDTYPHEDNLSRLFIYDMSRKHVIDVARLYSMPELCGEVRCDLHVSWNRDNSKVCFDSTHEGKRQIYVADIDAFLKK